MYGAQNHAGAAQGIGQLKTDRPMNRIEANLEDLNQTADSLEYSIRRLMEHATRLGYYVPEPQPPTTAPIDRAGTLHEGVKKVQRLAEVLDGALNVFD